MYPSYLNLTKKEFENRVKRLFNILEKCKICPRNCSVNRLKNEKGYCKVGYLPFISSYHPHFGEEPILVGRNGSGTIFFTSCNLSCIYCQNFEISQYLIGKEITFEELADIMLYLQNIGCHNINLVTPTPQIPQILKSLSIAIDKGLKIPLVYNTNSYDSIEVLKLLNGIFDIYLPDVKYADDYIAYRYSNAKNYFEIMKKAIKEMYKQVGNLILDKNGIAIRGLIIRHLVLPNNLAGSEKIFKFISKEISKDVFINIMPQYYPCYRAYEYPEFSRKITKEEFITVVRLAKKYGLKNIFF
ncbi:MAG: radical SAM protein [Candidatus Aenigmatarchaeota archaeon]